MRIAVLDDDSDLLELIKAHLERHHHVCHVYASGASLLMDTRHETFDLLIVEWHLPDMEGIDVVHSVRQGIGPQLPILFVTSRHDERDVVEALNRGADDYMVKPLRMGELAARVAALLRRAYPEALGAAARQEFGPYRFDLQKRLLLLRGTPLNLKHREYELALFMFRNAGRLLSRAHLREVVWGEINEAPSRSLDTHVSRLRSKLELTPESGYTITSVYGMGYRLDLPGMQRRATAAG
ncbi:response regulator transcription factor [Acidovorax sp. NPDC077693]|uniref:response regulator transcription factor n=1 Tax=unclassified Acidovorax TaxID=2684926 RepID=UPI0037CBBE62